MARKKLVVDEERQADLLAFAKKLVDWDFGIWAVGANKFPLRDEGDADTLPLDVLNDRALDQIERGDATGLAVRLGITVAQPTDDKHLLVPFVLEREGHATPEYRARMKSALLATKGITAFEKMQTQWSEVSPSGGQHWFGFVKVKDEEAFRAFERKLIKRSFIDAEGEQVLATEIIISGQITVAPSYGNVHPTGLPYQFVSKEDGVRNKVESIPILLPGAVLNIGKALSEASEFDVNPGRVRLAIPEIARPVVRLYNEIATDEQAVELLLEAGFTIHRGDLDTTGYVELTRPGATKSNSARSVTVGRPRRRGFEDEEHLPGGVYVWTASFTALPQGYHAPFDLYARLKHDGKPSRAVEHLVTSEEIDLTRLSDDERVALEDEEGLHFDPVHRDFSSAGNASTFALGNFIASKVRQLESPRGGAPYILRMAKGDANFPDELLVLPSKTRRPQEWKYGEEPIGTRVIMSAVQPARIVKDDNGVEHTVQIFNTVEPAIRTMVFENLLSDERVPTVTRTLNEPSLLRDNSGNLRLVQTNGYDPETNAIITFDENEWKDYNVNPAPSLEEAKRAFNYLTYNLLSNFYFETTGDYARVIAYLLTCVARPAVGATPGFGFDAPGKNAGKSKVALIGRILAIGGDGSYALIDDPSKKANEEIKKIAVTAVLGRGRFMHVDEPGGAAIEAPILMGMLTAQDGEQDLRILGGNNQLKMTGLILTAAGNNLRVGGDNNRRFLVARFQQPHVIKALHEERGFLHPDLLDYVRGDRANLLAAAHTVLLYGAQNAPASKYERLSSFERWADIVLGSMTHHVPEGDPNMNYAEWVVAGRDDWMREMEDISLTVWASPLEVLFKKYGEKPFTASQMADALRDARLYGSLPHALEDAIREKETRALGGAISRAVARVKGTSIPADKGQFFEIMTGEDRKAKQKVYTVRERFEGDTVDLTGFVSPLQKPSSNFAKAKPTKRTAERDNGEVTDL